jgi:hypothetical protein
MITTSASSAIKGKRRRLLLSVAVIFVVAIIAVASYAYYEFNRTNKDLKNVSPDITSSATELMKRFTDDFKVSDSLYKNKIVELTGTITKIDSTETPVIIFFGEKNSMSSIQCSMDSVHHQPYLSVMPGNTARVKGIYIGAISQELFGIDIKLNRCVFIN